MRYYQNTTFGKAFIGNTKDVICLSEWSAVAHGVQAMNRVCGLKPPSLKFFFNRLDSATLSNWEVTKLMAASLAQSALFTPGAGAKKDRFIRSNNVARISGVSERTVRKWAQSGLLAAYKHGPKIWFFKENDVRAFLEQTSRSTMNVP